jgi:hypothetical protein
MSEALLKRIDECMRLIDTLPSQKQFDRAVRQRDQLVRAMHLIIDQCQDLAGGSALQRAVEETARTALEVTGASQRGKPRYIKLRTAP